MDCTADNFADLAEWRADRGIPTVTFSALDDLVDAIVDASADGCPIVDETYSTKVWSGGCVTANGYGIEMTGTSWAWSDTAMWGAGEDWELTVAASGTADGTWPTGTVRIVRESTSGSRDLAAEWVWADAGTTGLPLTGTFTGGWGDGGSCSPYVAAYAGTLDGCTFSSTWANLGWVDEHFVREPHVVTVGGHTARVRTEVCGTIVGWYDGEQGWLDAAWGAVARTDTDGDLCAVEDCDCDDADPNVRPGAADVDGDARDSDCDGNDGVFSDDCPGLWDRCGAPVDTGADDTAPGDTWEGQDTDLPATDTDTPEDTASDTAEDIDAATGPGCGCSTGAAPSAGLLLAMIAFLRRRRYRPVAATIFSSNVHPSASPSVQARRASSRAPAMSPVR
jgi:MYXO-CTERM domain-containing protein